MINLEQDLCRTVTTCQQAGYKQCEHNLTRFCGNSLAASLLYRSVTTNEAGNMDCKRNFVTNWWNNLVTPACAMPVCWNSLLLACNNLRMFHECNIPINLKLQHSPRHLTLGCRRWVRNLMFQILLEVEHLDHRPKSQMSGLSGGILQAGLFFLHVAKIWRERFWIQYNRLLWLNVRTLIEPTMRSYLFNALEIYFIYFKPPIV